MDTRPWPTHGREGAIISSSVKATIVKESGICEQAAERQDGPLVELLNAILSHHRCYGKTVRTLEALQASTSPPYLLTCRKMLIGECYPPRIQCPYISGRGNSSGLQDN